MRSLTFENRFLIFPHCGVIYIELNIDWTSVSFGLMFIKINVQNDFSPKMW